MNEDFTAQMDHRLAPSDRAILLWDGRLYSEHKIIATSPALHEHAMASPVLQSVLQPLRDMIPLRSRHNVFVAAVATVLVIAIVGRNAGVNGWQILGLSAGFAIAFILGFATWLAIESLTGRVGLTVANGDVTVSRFGRNEQWRLYECAYYIGPAMDRFSFNPFHTSRRGVFLIFPTLATEAISANAVCVAAEDTRLGLVWADFLRLAQVRRFQRRSLVGGLLLWAGLSMILWWSTALLEQPMRRLLPNRASVTVTCTYVAILLVLSASAFVHIYWLRSNAPHSSNRKAGAKRHRVLMTGLDVLAHWILLIAWHIPGVIAFVFALLIAMSVDLFFKYMGLLERRRSLKALKAFRLKRSL